jgi:hypothetical protein
MRRQAVDPTCGFRFGPCLTDGTVGLVAIWKYLSSFFKTDWTLSDYPVAVRHFDVGNFPSSSRFKPIIWTATIFGWRLAGNGDTRDEALVQLRMHFDNYKKGSALPRPGTEKHLEFAVFDRIEKCKHLLPDFCAKILGLNSDAVFLSDESSLWDFHLDDSNETMTKKIQAQYLIDVTDLEEKGNIVSILERIEQQKKR